MAYTKENIDKRVKAGEAILDVLNDLDTSIEEDMELLTTLLVTMLQATKRDRLISVNQKENLAVVIQLIPADALAKVDAILKGETPDKEDGVKVTAIDLTEEHETVPEGTVKH